MHIGKIAFGILSGFAWVPVFGEYVAGVTMVDGPSMLPTLNSKSSNDVLIVEKISTNFERLKRRDIAIVRSPEDPHSFVCKRIVGMAGDIITTGPEEDEYIKVPKGHVWLLGDNDSNSHDSRDYGPVPYGLIQGRVFFKIWPLSEFGTIKDAGSC